MAYVSGLSDWWPLGYIQPARGYAQQWPGREHMAYVVRDGMRWGSRGAPATCSQGPVWFGATSQPEVGQPWLM